MGNAPDRRHHADSPIPTFWSIWTWRLEGRRGHTEARNVNLGRPAAKKFKKSTGIGKADVRAPVRKERREHLRPRGSRQLESVASKPSKNGTGNGNTAESLEADSGMKRMKCSECSPKYSPKDATWPKPGGGHQELDMI